MTFHRSQHKSLCIASGEGQQHCLPAALKERDGNVAVFETVEALPIGAPVEMLAAGGPLPGRVIRCRSLHTPDESVELSVEFSPTH